MSMATDIFRLQSVKTAELKQQYEKLWGEPSRSNNRQYLIKKIAWRMQEENRDGIPEALRRRALEIANPLDLRTRPRPGFGEEMERLAEQGRQEIEEAAEREERDPLGNWDPRLPMPGTVLTREYKGRKVEALIAGAKRFEYEGRVYRSLSAVAKAITGTQYNGFAFFGLAEKPGVAQ